MIQWGRSAITLDTYESDISPQIKELFFTPKAGGGPLIKAIIESITDGMIILNTAGCILYINDHGAQMLRLNGKEVLGKHVTQVVDFKPVILDALANKKGYMEKEFIIESPGMGTLYFIKSAIIIHNANNEVIGVIDTFRRVDAMHNKIAQLTGAKAKFCFQDIIGQTPAVKEVIEYSSMAAKSSANVLLEGESGTGKEMFAHSIHNAGSRRKGPFIIVNCASLPRSLIESELFGHESGSFTGARKEGYAGKFEQANNGTIFLDEIGEMPPDMQTKLLRVLQDKTFTRIGGKRNITTDARVIAATNKDLLTEVHRQNFREDLYYRLNVMKIHIPSLRERPADIPLLASYFTEKSARKLGRKVPRLSVDVMEYLQDYHWPGNIRELENAIERALIIAHDDVILPAHLPETITAHRKNSREHVHYSKPQNTPVSDSRASLFSRNLESLEKEEIERALFYHQGNIAKSARQLGISRNTLYRKMRKYRKPK